MSDQPEEDLHSWIREVAATSEPVTLDEVMAQAAHEHHRVEPQSTAPPGIEDLPTLDELNEENRMNGKQRLLVLAAAAIIVVGVAVAFVIGGGSDGSGVDADLNEPTEFDQGETTTTSAVAVGEGLTRVDLASAYWEGLEAMDLDAMTATLDPALVSADVVTPFGYGGTIAEQLQWYEAVGWVWEFDECVPGQSDIDVECTATAMNAWTEARGVPPVTSTFLMKISDKGVAQLIDPDDLFIAQWSPRAFEPFARWVGENYPDDAADMWGPGEATYDDILGLFRTNTERYAAAQAEE